MNEEIQKSIAADLLSIPPLVFRTVRKKLITTTLSETSLDIKYPHAEILRLLEEKGTLQVAQIGEKLLIAKAQMTHLLDRLVEYGLVEREMNAADRRTINISLTEKGKNFIRERGECFVNTLKENMDTLSKEELEALSTSLRYVRDTLLKFDEKPDKP
jgi:MarR family transcriptional regulator, organic hydroperoxide resistance regulator